MEGGIGEFDCKTICIALWPLKDQYHPICFIDNNIKALLTSFLAADMI